VIRAGSPDRCHQFSIFIRRGGSIFASLALRQVGEPGIKSKKGDLFTHEAKLGLKAWERRCQILDNRGFVRAVRNYPLGNPKQTDVLSSSARGVSMELKQIGELIVVVAVVVVVGHEIDKFYSILRDIRDSLRNIESHLTEQD
jgi:hypothetical protein